jgi:hypothetical protein
MRAPTSKVDSLFPSVNSIVVIEFQWALRAANRGSISAKSFR